MATILSAQCTDERVNKVTPAPVRQVPVRGRLRRRRPGRARAGRSAPPAFSGTRRRTSSRAAGRIVARHGGEVPRTLEELTALPGVGRKTANVILGNAFGIPGIVVDTHVGRVAARLGLAAASDPVKIEFELMPLVPRERWVRFSHQLIAARPRALPGAAAALRRRASSTRALCPSRAAPAADPGLPPPPERLYSSPAAVAPGIPPGAPGSRSRPDAMRKEGSRWKSSARVRGFAASRSLSPRSRHPATPSSSRARAAWARSWSRARSTS